MPSSKTRTPARRSPARPGGAATFFVLRRSSSGRTAPTGCTIACATAAKGMAGFWSAFLRRGYARGTTREGEDMAGELKGKRIAVLATNGVEDSELREPYKAVAEAGADADVVSLEQGEIEGKKGTKFKVDKLVTEGDASDYDGLVLPGGVANPDKLRTDEKAVRFVRDFFEQGKPVGVICHGGWTLVEADVVRGRKVTSYPSIKTDLRNAGAEVVDEEVVTDEGIVTSRNPDDLPAFT